MTVVFYTNFINHHQVPLADEFYRILGDDYKMVTFEPLPESFRLKGYADYSYKPYLIEAFRSEESMERARQLAIAADIVILGAAPEWLIHERLRINKITFRYGERLFKKIDGRFLRRSFWKRLYDEHTRYRNKPLYMLAASAYMKSDVRKLFAYPNKVFKWGYFTNASEIDIHQVLEGKRNIDKIRILWCGSFTQVKRPDLIVQLAYMLKKENINFHIDMVGEASGWTGLIQDMIADLDVADCVSMLGSFPNEQLLRMMQEYHIFAFTSDRGEGWGVVLNEAMGKWKSRKDLSGGKKTAEEIEKDRLQSQLSGDMTKKDINDIFENFPNMSKAQQDFYEALLQYDSLEGTYIGQYGKEDIIIEASNLKDKMQAIRKQDLDDHSRELLLEKMNEIDMAMSAQGNRKGDFYSGVLGAPINKTLFQGLESKRYDFSEIDEY